MMIEEEMKGGGMKDGGMKDGGMKDGGVKDVEMKVGGMKKRGIAVAIGREEKMTSAVRNATAEMTKSLIKTRKHGTTREQPKKQSVAEKKMNDEKKKMTKGANARKRRGMLTGRRGKTK